MYVIENYLFYEANGQQQKLFKYIVYHNDKTTCIGKKISSVKYVYKALPDLGSISLTETTLFTIFATEEYFSPFVRPLQDWQPCDTHVTVTQLATLCATPYEWVRSVSWYYLHELRTNLKLGVSKQTGVMTWLPVVVIKKVKSSGKTFPDIRRV